MYLFGIIFCMLFSLSFASSGPEKPLVDPESVQVVSVEHAQQRLVELEQSSKTFPDWKTIQASEVYKAHKQHLDRAQQLFRETQQLKQDLAGSAKEHEKKFLAAALRQLDSAWLSSTGDIAKFEIEQHMCPFLLDKQKEYAIFWRARYEQLQKETTSKK